MPLHNTSWLLLKHGPAVRGEISQLMSSNIRRMAFILSVFCKRIILQWIKVTFSIKNKKKKIQGLTQSLGIQYPVYFSPLRTGPSGFTVQMSPVDTMES